MSDEAEVIEKTPEEIAEDFAILTHCIVDPQEWVDRAITNNMEWAIQAKVEENRQNYINARYLSITVDPETGEETRIENPDYMNRAERDAMEELQRDPLYGKTPEETIVIKKQQINNICQAKILARFSLIYQANVANGLYPDNGMKQWIADMITESNRCTDLIELNQPAFPNWPVYVEVI